MSISPLPVHPRALIRRAVCALLRASGFPGPVFSSREEPWLADELPCIGVYTTDETRRESDRSPEPDERELTVVIDILDRENPDEPLDDRLDALSLYPETALFFEAVRDAVAQAAENARMKPADMPVLDFLYGSAAIGEAEDGRRVVACATLTFRVTYRMPPPKMNADDLKTIVSGWDLADFPPPCGGPDGTLEAENINIFPWPEDDVTANAGGASRDSRLLSSDERSARRQSCNLSKSNRDRG